MLRLVVIHRTQQNPAFGAEVSNLQITKGNEGKCAKPPIPCQGLLKVTVLS